MSKIRFRNVKGRIWHWMLGISVIACCVSVGLVAFMMVNALTPDRVTREGQFCGVTADWMSEAFAVEAWNDVDTIDYHLIKSGDWFVIVATWIDDENFRSYIDSLYDANGNYEAVEMELMGSSKLVDNDLRSMAVEELAYDTGLSLTEQDFDAFIYPYYIDTTDMGDFSTVCGIWVLVLLLMIAMIIVNIVMSIRHHGRVAALKRQPYYDELTASWERSGTKMDTGYQRLIVLPGYLVTPASRELAVPLANVAWCYAIRGGAKDTLYIMNMEGHQRYLCEVKNSGSTSTEAYMKQIHLNAPWCRIGYTDANRMDFSDANKRMTIEKIMLEKEKYLSQIPL